MVKISRKDRFQRRWVVAVTCILALAATLLILIILERITEPEDTWNYEILLASDTDNQQGVSGQNDASKNMVNSIQAHQHNQNNEGQEERLPEQNLDVEVHRVQKHPRKASPTSQMDATIVTNIPVTTTTATSAKKARLRLDWTNLQLYSPLAKDMLAHQTNCSLPVINFRYRNRFGLGSDLHVWSQGLCNAFESQVRVRSQHPWIFWDEDACKQYADQNSSMVCYFPGAELTCPGDNEDGTTEQVSFSNHLGCKGMLEKYGGQFRIPEIRSAAMEFLFRNVSTVLLKEAERQLNLVFPNGVVPPNLITVHMRWGDKKQEMKLRKPWEYARAVRQILEKRAASIQIKNQTAVDIFLATEDPEALRQFRDAAPDDWNIYIDQFYTEMLPYRIDEYNGGPKMSRLLKGKTGLIALGSLLVSMESDYFVLTTASNWSRLMNELRKNVLDPRCKNCTLLIDLKSGEW